VSPADAPSWAVLRYVLWIGGLWAGGIQCAVGSFALRQSERARGLIAVARSPQDAGLTFIGLGTRLLRFGAVGLAAQLGFPALGGQPPVSVAFATFAVVAAAWTIVFLMIRLARRHQP
jgi:hypothetical protein